jgi:hypothetical protein
VLAQEPSDRLKVYSVWVPMVRGLERDIPQASRVLPDPRAEHYWDGDRLLMDGYQRVLQISEPAWDVFLVYGPEARWDGDDPPAPQYWAHQLGTRENPRVHGPFLDGPTFLDKTREALSPATRP